MDKEEPTLQTVQEDEDIFFNTKYPEVFIFFFILFTLIFVDNTL